MSDYKAIAAVGETLISFLKDKIKELSSSSDSIVLASPREAMEIGGISLSLFLYQILENIYLKNREPKVTGSSCFSFPSVALDLYYMMTAYPNGNGSHTEKTLQAHRLMGRVVQVLNENPILTGSILKGGLDPDEELHVTIASSTLDDLTKIWGTFQNNSSFLPSVCYLITPVIIDSPSPQMSEKRVVSKEINCTYVVPAKGEK